jgi:hypothetical protein
MVGKTVPADIATYLQANSDQLAKEYRQAYPRFALTEVNREAASKLEELAQMVKIQQQQIKELTDRVRTLESDIFQKVIRGVRQ